MAASFPALRVLLVEDNPGDVRLLQAALDEARTGPVELEWVDCLADALSRLGESTSFDAVLLDLSLPDSHGLPTVQQVLSQSPGLPIVVLSGLDDEQLALEAVLRGAQDYLVKGRIDGHLVARTIRYAVERQRARAAEAHLAAIVAASDDAIIGLTLEGQITSWNRGAEQLYGYKSSDALGLELRHLAAPEHRAELRQVLEELGGRTDGTELTRRLEMLHVDREGNPISVSAHLSVLGDPVGRPVGIACIARDMRERLAAEATRAELAKAEQAVRLRDEFLSVAAHELRTPLTSLRGYAQLLERQLAGGVDLDRDLVARALAVFTAQSFRVQALLDQLLDVSSLWGSEAPTHKLRLRVQETDVAALVRTAVAAIRITAPTRSVRLQAPDSLLARVDPLRWEQIIANLVGNALKFSPPETAVDVDLALVDPGVARLRVRDWGGGVPRDVQQRIFERYFQRPEHRQFPGGMGLGLYITRQIVEEHGGTILVENPPDGGACFSVTLPLPGTEARSNP